MVWQVREGGGKKEAANPRPPTAKSSRASSSAPQDSEDNPDLRRRSPSIGMEVTESMTSSSLMQFNKDVESMIDHGTDVISKENDDEDDDEAALREDFTQQLSKI
jgi:hypothetical protein